MLESLIGDSCNCCDEGDILTGLSGKWHTWRVWDKKCPWHRLLQFIEIKKKEMCRSGWRLRQSVCVLLQCWASTSARRPQTPTSPSPWRAGGACWTGSGTPRRRSQCPVMLCPLSNLVSSYTDHLLCRSTVPCYAIESKIRCFVFPRRQQHFCDRHRPLQKPDVYPVLPEVGHSSSAFIKLTDWPYSFFCKAPCAPTLTV